MMRIGSLGASVGPGGISASESVTVQPPQAQSIQPLVFNAGILSGGSYTYNDPEANPEALQNPVFNRVWIDYNPTNDVLNEDGEIIDGMVLNFNAEYFHPQGISEGTRTYTLRDYSDDSVVYTGTNTSYTTSGDTGTRFYLEATPVDSQGNTGVATKSAITVSVNDGSFSPTIAPLPSSTDIAIDSNISFTFDRRVYDATSNSLLTDSNFSNITFEVRETDDQGSLVAGTATVINTATATTISFDPTADLSNNQVYYVEISGIQNVNGGAYSTSHTFTTVAATPSVLQTIIVNVSRFDSNATYGTDTQIENGYYHNNVTVDGTAVLSASDLIDTDNNTISGSSFSTNVALANGNTVPVYAGVEETGENAIVRTKFLRGMKTFGASGGTNVVVTFTLSGIDNGTWRARATGWTSNTTYRVVTMDGDVSKQYDARNTPAEVATSDDKVVGSGTFTFTLEDTAEIGFANISAIAFERIA